ncbi:MAG TPA: DUF2142 domain-containing protein, partial [Solirubrobacteraceae bacterium]|nr:DUF2142 domain-containing protein [Solirubrobacteraceae bacterium]
SAQTAAAAVCSQLPMVDFIEGTVSPDGLLMLLWALAFLAGAKVLSGRLRWGWALAAATLAAIAVKFPSAALAPGIVVVVAAAYQRHARWPGTLRGRRLVVAGIVAAAVVVAVGVIVSGVLAGQLKAAFALPADHTVRGAIGEFLSYLWQYYLPRLPWQTKYEMHYAGLPLWTTSFRGYVGAFGWLEVVLAPGVYIAAAVLAGAALVGGLHSILARARRHVATILFFLVTAITLMIGLHWTDYQIIENDQGHFMQARYLLPLNPLVALVIAAAVGPRLARRPRAQSLALGGVLGGLLALQLLSLGTVLLRFYG